MAPLDTLLNLTFIILVSDFYFFVVLCVIPLKKGIQTIITIFKNEYLAWIPAFWPKVNRPLDDSGMTKWWQMDKNITVSALKFKQLKLIYEGNWCFAKVRRQNIHVLIITWICKYTFFIHLTQRKKLLYLLQAIFKISNHFISFQSLKVIQSCGLRIEEI